MHPEHHSLILTCFWAESYGAYAVFVRRAAFTHCFHVCYCDKLKISIQVFNFKWTWANFLPFPSFSLGAPTLDSLMIEPHIVSVPWDFFSVASCSRSTVVHLLEVVCGFFFFFSPYQFLISSSCFQGKPSENPHPGQNCCSVYVDCFSLSATDKRQEGVGPEIRGCSSREELSFASWVSLC